VRLSEAGFSDTSAAGKAQGLGKWASQGVKSMAQSAKNVVTGTNEAEETHSPAGAMQQRCAARSGIAWTSLN
jgi:hypothetical protein